MRIFGIVVILVILLVVGALVAPQFIDWNKYKGQIISQIDASTGFQAKIDGDLDLAVLPMPRVVVNQLSLTNPSEQSSLLSLDYADVYLDVMPLLSGKVSLKSITLNKPQITLRVQKDGSKNWMTDVLMPGDGDSTASSKSSSDLAIGSLSIKDGLLSYEDLQKNTKQEFKEINGTFSMESLHGPFDVAGSVNALGYPLSINARTEKMDTDNETVAANIKAGLKGAELNFSGVIGYGETPDGQGELSVTIANLKSFLEEMTGTKQSASLDMAIKTSGIVTATTDKVDYTNLVAVIGDETLKGQASLDKITDYPRKPLQLETDLTGNNNLRLVTKASLSTDRFRVFNANFGYKSSKANGAVSYTFPSGGQKARAEVNLASSLINLDELMAVSGTKSSSSAPKSLKETAKSYDLPIDATLQITADEIIYNGKTLESVRLNGSTTGPKLVVNEIYVREYAGATFTLKGDVANLPGLSGLNLDGSMKTEDLETTMAALGQGALLKDMPAKIGAMELDVSLDGSLDSLVFDTKVNALDGTLTAKGTATSVETSPGFTNVNLGIKHPNLADLLQKFSPESEKNAALARAVDLSSNVDLKDKIYTLNDLKGSFGPISLDGSIVADMRSEKPVMTGEMKTGTLPLETFMKASSGGTGTGAGGGGKWSNEPIDTAWMKSADVDLKMAASQITYGGWKFEKPSFGLQLKDSVLSVNKWSAGLFGGTSQLDLQLSGKQGVSMKSSLSLDNVGLQSLVVALTGAPIVQSKGVADMKTELAASGASMAALISSLSGDGTVNGTDITIRGLDVAELSRAMNSAGSLGSQAKALFKSGIKGGTSQFDTLAGEFTVQNGIVNFSKLDLTGEEAVVATIGNVSLPAWTLDMKSSVQLIVSETNEAGETVEPPPPLEISYRGSLSNPGSSFAQNAIEGYLNKKIADKASKLIQDKLGDKLDGELGGVIGGLLGVPPKQQQQQAPTGQEEPAAGDQGAANDNNTPSPYTPESTKLQQQQQQQQPKKIEPEDVIKDVLKGFLQ